jgi:phosphoserine phosphatase
LRDAIKNGAIVQFRMDFDRTLTTPDSISTWETSSKVLTGHLAAQSQYDRALYMRLQREKRLKPEVQEAWSKRELGRHAMHGTTEQALQKEAAHIELRPGVEKLFDLFKMPQMQPVIVSAGIGNIIEASLALHNLQMPPEHIISNRFGVPGELAANISLVSTHTKREHLDINFPHSPNLAYYTVALGDALTDAAMADDLCIRTGKDGGNTPGYFEESLAAGFDLVLNSDDLSPVAELFLDLALAA